MSTRILRGTKPGDIPVEQPIKFELVINLTTAKALGLTCRLAPAARRRGDRVNRRAFITLLGGAAAAWPLAARAQQAGMPVIGFLSSVSESVSQLPGFRRGLGEAGFVEHQNVMIEYRFATGQYERLPGMAAELVARQVALIIAVAPPAALAAKAATATVPVIFAVGFDPVVAGLVERFNRPGGNVTGLTLITSPLGQKRLELLIELVPKASLIGMLVNSKSPNTEPDIRAAEAVARANGRQLKVFSAATVHEIDAAWSSVVASRVDALLIGSDPFFVDRKMEMTALAAHHRMPTIYPFRDFTESGGLISYGASLSDAYRQVGIYAGRILKGAKPADLPVLQPTTFELVINIKTAKLLGLPVPATLHARADEVIE